MMSYAYLDSGKIMHVVEEKTTAERSSGTGKVIETEIECGGGYPVAGGERIIVYSETEMKTDATKPAIKDADKKYPQLAALYKRCK